MVGSEFLYVLTVIESRRWGLILTPTEPIALGVENIHLLLKW
jgi:hypothetical protein